MTVIVGIIDGNVVLMGADSAATNESGNLTLQKNAKLFNLTIRSTKGKLYEMVVGYAGNFYVAQQIEFGFRPPVWNTEIDVRRYLIQYFVPALKKVLAFDKKSEQQHVDTASKEVFGGASFLIGFQKRLFILEENGQVEENLQPFAAIGCGAGGAIGAFHALQQMQTMKTMTTWDVLDCALVAAEQSCCFVKAPFHMSSCMSTSIP